MAKRVYFKAVTPPAVLAYGYIHKTDSEGKYADGKFKGDFVYEPDHPAVADMQAQAKAAAKEEFGSQFKMSEIKWPFKDGNKVKLDKDTGKPRDEFANKQIITAKTKDQPKVVDAKRQPLADGVEARSGDLVKASITFAAGVISGTPTVYCYLNAIQLLEKRSGSYDAADDFDDEDYDTPAGVAAANSDNDFGGGGDLDDEIPF